ncbi:MAG: 16S rRNA (uracil(1498)-N(3))-methyltransferase [Chitinophagaceae bacterium]|nr:16S rRNA (uracil(1498)-N(3))-methyltransferase [Chitinophagaceae bacterium]
MALPIFYLDQYQNQNVILLNEETSRHVIQVLRMKKGELLQLTDGKGALLTASIIDDHKKNCTVGIKEKMLYDPPGKKVSIAISLLKNASRFEWFLEKATEIGVAEIVPLKCDRTEKQHFRFDRMNNILIADMLQSQQTWLPVLNEPLSVRDAIIRSASTCKLVAHCQEVEKHSIREFACNPSTQILIGPEGDFSPNEIEGALAQNYVPVTLGQTRLRAETAGVVAATLLCM